MTSFQFQIRLRDPAARCVRVVHVSFAREGVGNAGRPMHPQPRVRNRIKHTSVVTTVTPEITRHSPRNGFTAYFALSPAIGLVCHRRLARLLARLDAGVEASEPHDFAVRLKRRSSCSAISVHRIPPRVRDVRNAPLWDGTARISELIWVRREQEYFCKWGWTGRVSRSA